MDTENIAKIKELLDEIFEKGIPTEEELDYDFDAIEMYNALLAAKDRIERFGL